MNIGILTEEGISFLHQLITSSDITRTNVIESPIPMPLATLVVTAIAEHKPIISIKSGFSFTIPFKKICPIFFNLRLHWRQASPYLPAPRS
jgi:hypothetical protein